MRGEYPRAFFFRAAESPGKNPKLSYEEWERSFSRLMGIEGKTLNEELPGIAGRNIEFFTRFKREHPDQIVLLHFNGNARDPNFQTDEYFAGHWIYFNGARILSDVPLQEGETEIKVENPALFRVNVGRYRNKAEDIGLCALSADGKPDWRQSEQVQLISVDAAKRTIRVRRGCYGTRPRAFAAGKAYAAAHVHEGPWGGPDSNLMWFYNYSTRSPRDQKGRSAADVLIDELVRRFSPGGELAAYDGVEFDVLMFTNRYHPDLRNPTKSGRGMDADADGRIDQAIFDGVETYGIGVTEFCRRLRARFPKSKLLLADGMGAGNQRAFEILNGIESEGFPHLRDLEMRDWSGGLNRHFFWQKNARPPAFSYINHKYTQPDPKTGLPVKPDVPFGIHRLSFAAGVFTDAAICYSFAPEAEPGERIGIWDELKMGAENKIGWLGKPLGPPLHLAERSADLLDGKGRAAAALAAHFRGERLNIAADGAALKIWSEERGLDEMRFRLTGIPLRGPDLYVSLSSHGAPRRGYPPEIARIMRLAVKDSRSGPFMTWLGRRAFTSGFYFAGVEPGNKDLEFAVEGGEPLWISRITVHGHPDVMYREFENGIVLANPSPRPYAFNLAELAPGKSFRRLKGSPRQDPRTNDGSPAGAIVELPPKDALFLVKQGGA